MCEANAFIVKGDRKELLLESVDEVEIEGDEVKVINIFGEQKVLRARFLSYSASNRELLFEASTSP